MMIDYVYDDGGRTAAGYKGEAGDCVTRAVAILTGRDYRDVYRMMARAEKEFGSGRRSARNGVNRKASKTVYDTLGLKKVRLPSGPRPTYAEAYEQYGDCMVSTVGHVAALVGGALRDTFDGRTYPWLEWYCRDCREDMGLGDADASGGGHRCEECGDRFANGMVGFEIKMERKARSVWVVA